MVKCIVVDDEPSAIQLLERYIERTPILELVGSETDPKIAARKIASGDLKPDLAFLDIEMPGCNGMDLADLLKPYCKIIFTTAYSEYGAEAFDKEAIDFLTKIIRYDRFLIAVNKYVATLNVAPSKNEGQVKMKDDFFFINGGKKGLTVRADFQNIVYIESSGHYLIFYFDKGEQQLITTTFSAVENQLPDYFLRIQRSFIINLKKIEKLEGNCVFLSRTNKTIICGVEYRETLRRYINERMLCLRNGQGK